MYDSFFSVLYIAVHDQKCTVMLVPVDVISHTKVYLHM